MHSKSIFHRWAHDFGIKEWEMQAAWEAWDAHERLMWGKYKKLQLLYTEAIERHNRLTGSLNKKPEPDTKTKSLF